MHNLKFVISRRLGNTRPQDTVCKSGVIRRWSISPSLSSVHPMAYHHDKKIPIHLLLAGLTTSGSGLVYSNPRTMHVLLSSIAPRLDKIRPQGTACHPESLCAGLKSNNHACPLVSRSVNWSLRRGIH